MPVILNTHCLNIDSNRRQPFKIIVSSIETRNKDTTVELESKLYSNSKYSVLNQKNINRQRSKSPLQKNKNLKSNQLTPCKITQKKSRQKNRDLSKRLFQKAKIIDDPKVQTYLTINSHKKNNPQIRKTQSSRQLLKIQKEKNDYNFQTFQVFSPKIISQDKNNKSKILSKVSQESVQVQENSINFQQYLVKPLKKQMIDTIKERNSTKLNKLNQSDIHFLNHLKEGLLIKKTQEIDYKTQDSIDQPKLLKNQVMLSSLSRLILQPQRNVQNENMSILIQKSTSLFQQSV